MCSRAARGGGRTLPSHGTPSHHVCRGRSLARAATPTPTAADGAHPHAHRISGTSLALTALQLVGTHALRLRNHSTVPIPAKVITTEPTRCAAAAPSAHSARPCCTSVTSSAEKVEKVVSPPQKPVITNSRHSGATAV